MNLPLNFHKYIKVKLFEYCIMEMIDLIPPIYVANIYQSLKMYSTMGRNGTFPL